MKKPKPNCYEAAKGRLRRRANTRHGIRLAAALAIVFCIAAIVIAIPDQTHQQPQAPAGTDVPRTETPPPVPTESKQPSETPPPIAAKEIRLNYEDVESSPGKPPAEVSRIEAKRIERTSVVVKRTIEADGMDDLLNFVVYVKNEGESELYIGMVAPGGGSDREIYEIGQIGELPYLNDVEIFKSNLFGQFHLRAYGPCGANCVMNVWFRFEDSVPGVPVSDFRLQAFAEEIDLDEDGTPEVVASEASTISNTQIYKKDGDRIQFVDLNETLLSGNPGSVVFDAKRRVFTAYFPDRTIAYQYKKHEDVLALLEDSS
ncbi:hypothetical protein [Cohnella terricola]|uniref:Uncharacterized protein n=1 Tax=Cohnella terricola TaxID=1289167 RepID=A0A559JKU3_9BACL|nr:hypothetical protein [Cohnella terricola]TVY00496.1 hypothetical protein FPZ45_10735 [Cohnella terricola]